MWECRTFVSNHSNSSWSLLQARTRLDTGSSGELHTSPSSPGLDSQELTSVCRSAQHPGTHAPSHEHLPPHLEREKFQSFSPTQCKHCFFRKPFQPSSQHADQAAPPSWLRGSAVHLWTLGRPRSQICLSRSLCVPGGQGQGLVQALRGPAGTMFSIQGGGSYTSVHQKSPQGLLKHRLLGAPLRVSDSEHPGRRMKGGGW